MPVIVSKTDLLCIIQVGGKMNKILIIVSVVGFLFSAAVMGGSTNDTTLALGFISAVSWLFVIYRLVDSLDRE